MATATLIFLLLILVAVSGLVGRFVRVPLPILQIALGVLLAWPSAGLKVELEPEVFLLVFVPPLLFLDAYLAPKREFLELKTPILGLAFGLVFLTIVLFGYALHWLLPVVPLPVAFALAAVLSPTDAVAVSSIVNRDLVPARVMHILEGESLLNDASGLVVFRFAVAAAMSGQFSLGETAVSFILVTSGGVAAGIVGLLVTARLMRLIAKLGDIRPEVQVLVLGLMPFAVYLLAERFGASGILAAVTAGLNVGRSGLFGSLSVPARLQNMALIGVLSFVFNGCIFLVLGLQLPHIVRAMPPELADYGPGAALGLVLSLTLVLIVIRFAWINFGSWFRKTVNSLRGHSGERLDMRLKIVGSLAGVRGAITLAGVLSLPFFLPDGTPFPARDLCIFLAAGVIVCSLGLASLTLPRLARGIALPQEDVIANEERNARSIAAEAAIDRIEQLIDAGAPDPETVETRRAVASQMIALYRQRVVSLQDTEMGSGSQTAAVVTEFRRAAVDAERTALRRLLAEGRINDETFHVVLRELVLAEALTHRRAQ